MPDRLPYTVPGVDDDAARDTIALLDHWLISLIDLSLTLKHVHWNVVGRSFIAVHEMLDPQAAAARGMVDEVTERIATLGGTATGTPGALVARRGWDDYPLGKASVPDHLTALDEVYTTIVAEHRAELDRLADLDPVSEDLLIGHLRQLEQFQWFIRAHLEATSAEA